MRYGTKTILLCMIGNCGYEPFIIFIVMVNEVWKYIICITTSFLFPGEDDLVDVMGYLHTLEKSQLSNLGLVLGLSLHHVRGLMDSKTFLGDVVLSWLSQADSVATRSGVPTWRSLVKALRHQLLGQNGIASQIATDKSLE